MANNFFKIKNGVNLPTLSADPTVTPPTNSATGDMAFYGGKLYKYNGSAWVVSPGSGTTGLIINTDVDAAAAIDGTKINPDFGAQLVKTTSKLEVISNTSAEAVLITQTGAGNALVVEDSSNPDATATVIDASGNVGIGVAANAILTEKLKVVGDVKVDSTGAITIPVGADGGRPGTPAQGMIRYNTTQSAFEGYDGTTWSSIGGATTIDRITQATHGFAVGEVLYLNGSTYTRARADVAATAEVVGMVSRVIDANTFELTICGEVVGLAAARFDELALPSTGAVVFLSPTNAGNMTITAPTVVGQISLPIGVASASGSIYVRPSRGVTVGGANVRTQINLTNNATTTVQNASAYDAGELAGWVYIDATADTRFYIQAQFAKNGASSDFNLAYQTTGDTPPVGFSMTITAAGLIQVTLPSVAGFSSAIINFALNAPAVGATLPLQIASTSVSFTDIQASTASGITFKEDGGTAIGSVSDAGAWSFGQTPTTSSSQPHVINVSGLPSGAAANKDAVSLVGANGNTDKLITRFNRTGTGSSWTDCTWEYRRRVDSSDFQFIRYVGANDIEFGTGATVSGLLANGAWTLGPSSSNVNHTANGSINFAATTTTGNAASVYQSGARLRLNGGTGGYAFQSSDGVTSLGLVESTGAWTLGPTSSLTSEHKIQNSAAAATYLLSCQKNTGADSTSNYYLLFTTNTTQQGYIWNDAAGNIGLGTLSDLSLKDNIRPLDSGLEKVKQLKPAVYDWKSGSAKNSIGFIAQEFEQVFPNAVGEIDGLKGISFGPEFHAVLVKAIQEQQEQIEALKAEIQLLKNK